MLVIWATGRPGVDAAELEAALDEELAGLAGAEESEIQRAIHLMEVDRLEELQRAGERADQLSMFASLFDDPGRINTELDRLRAVGVDEVRGFAGRYLTASNAGTLVYTPTEDTARPASAGVEAQQR